MAGPIVSLQKISKNFGSVQANYDINLDIKGGHVHALLGENGAGKSTLMSILAGRYKPGSGTILIDGQPVSFGSPAAALDYGIGMVYQRFMLIETMTVAENLLLSASKKMAPADSDILILSTAEQYGLEIDPHKYVSELSMGERQRVEIIKLLLLEARVLIFDEPTAVLTPAETEILFSIIRALRSDNRGIVFITHKLEEVLELADEISVMRKGRLIISTEARSSQISKRQLARLMVGRDVVLQVEKDQIPAAETVLSLEGLSGGTVGETSAFHDVSFEVRKGEIFSIIGVAGNGQSGLVAAITGLTEATGGKISFLGTQCTPRQWMRYVKGCEWAYVPEDRYHMGCVGAMSIGDNFGLTKLSHYSSGPGGITLDRSRMAADCTEAISAYNIKAESADDRAHSLSGGNLQKVILARELSRKPKLFIAEQPTQGLDISATEDIWKALLASRKDSAVLLITGDLKEVLSLSDRIGVIFNGRILEIIDASDADAIGRVGLLMAGVTS